MTRPLPLPQEKLESDPYLRSRVGAIHVEAGRKALYRCEVLVWLGEGDR